MTTILAWPARRLALARLTNIANGSLPPPAGASLLVSTPARPVEVSFSTPAEPDRICIYGIPLRATFREFTAEDPSQLTELATVAFRIRVYEPGEDEFHADQTLGDMCAAVQAALSTTPLAPAVRMWLAALQQEQTVLSASPDPAVVVAAAMAFNVEAVSYAG